MPHDLTPIPLYLFILNELSLIPSNYGLLILSRDSTRDNFIRSLLHNLHEDNLSKEYLEWLFLFHPSDVLRIMEVEHMSISEVSLNIKKAIETLGIENVINDIGIEKVIDAVGIEKLEREIQKRKQTKHKKTSE